MKKRKTFDDQFKARVALEAVKGEKTIAQVASEYGVHLNLLLIKGDDYYIVGHRAITPIFIKMRVANP